MNCKREERGCWIKDDAFRIGLKTCATNLANNMVEVFLSFRSNT